MRRKFSLFLVLLLWNVTVPAFADRPSYEERLEEARDSAKDKEWPEAIRQYEELSAEVGNSPRGEAIKLELAGAYFSSGSMGQTVAVCSQFLAAYPASPAFLQVQHLKAFALWSQGLFEESLSVFADHKWEDLRKLPEKHRARVYDVIARALRGTYHENAGRVVRLESREPLKNAKGKFLLSGKLRDSLTQWETDEGWAAFLARVPAAVRPRLAEEEKSEPIVEDKLRWGSVALSLAVDSSTVKTALSNYSQLFLNAKLDLDFNLSPAGSQATVSIGYSLVPLSLPSGMQYRWIDTGAWIRGMLVGNRGPGFSFLLNLGVFYRNSQVLPQGQPRLDYALGFDVFPSFRYRFNNGMSLGWYGKISPFVQSMKQIDLGSNLIYGGGMDFQLAAIPEKLWLSFFGEAELIRFAFDDGSRFENMHLRFGVKSKF